MMEYQPVYLSSNQSQSDICQMKGCGMKRGERREERGCTWLCSYHIATKHVGVSVGQTGKR